jgi:hypothetical protein
MGGLERKREAGKGRKGRGGGREGRKVERRKEGEAVREDADKEAEKKQGERGHMRVLVGEGTWACKGWWRGVAPGPWMLPSMMR